MCSRSREKRDRKIVGINMDLFVSGDRIQKRNKRVALYCHRKINSITWICGNVGVYHVCDHIINGTITIFPCPDNCKVCREEIDKREHYDCRWQRNEDGYTVCGMCMETLGCQGICEACFCIGCEKEKKGYSRWEDCEGCDDLKSFLFRVFVSCDQIQKIFDPKKPQIKDVFFFAECF